MPRLAAGDKMPNFEFNTGYRTGVTLRGEWKGKIVLWVLRYIGCTVCRYDCKLIADRYDEFMKKDAKVFVLMQSDQEHIQNDMKNTNAWLPFEIISDPEMNIYKALDIKPAESMEALIGDRMEDLKAKSAKVKEAGFVHGDYEGDEQQLPAMFIIDENDVVTYAHYVANLMDMPNIDDLLAKL
ncbi:MAG: redoxin domain-containing protein [Solobacterium sp.]|nr:redoxin domain-containing protein [Solobacterium sp.]